MPEQIETKVDTSTTQAGASNSATMIGRALIDEESKTETPAEPLKSIWAVTSCPTPNVALCEEFDKRVKELDSAIVRVDSVANYKAYNYVYGKTKKGKDKSDRFIYLYPKIDYLIVHLRDQNHEIEGLYMIFGDPQYGEVIVADNLEVELSCTLDMAIGKVKQAYELVKIRQHTRSSGGERTGQHKIRQPKARVPREVWKAGEVPENVKAALNKLTAGQVEEAKKLASDAEQVDKVSV